MGGPTLNSEDLAQDARTAGERFRLLQNVSDALAHAVDVDQSARAVLSAIVPDLADSATIEWVSGSAPRAHDVIIASRDGASAVHGLHDGELSVDIETLDGVVARIRLTREADRPFDSADRETARQVARVCGFVFETVSNRSYARQARDARDKALSLLDAILSESPLGLAFFDKDLRFQRVNAAFAEMSGLPEQKHVGAQLLGALPRLGQMLLPALRETLDGRTVAEQEIEGGALPGDAENHHWVAHYYPLRDAQGAIVGAGVVLLDVTERRRADEARQRSESQLRLALDATRMGLWFWDLSTRELRWSTTNAALLGLDPLAPASLEALADAIHEDDRDRVLRALEHTANTGDALEETFRVVWADGSDHWILTKGQAQSHDEQVTEMVGIQIDITETRAAQDERARLALRQARAGEQAVRMQRVTAALSEALTISQVCDVILQEGSSVLETPRGMVALLSEDRQHIETVRLAGWDDSSALDLGSVANGQSVALYETVRDGRMVLIGEGEEIARTYPDIAGLVAERGTEAVAVIPLTYQGSPLGSWILTWPETREFEEGEIIILLTLAAQAGQALERARMYERERAIATSLQRTLLPSRLPSIPGVTTARRYLPSTEGIEVGGDWYDVLRFSDNRIALVIGDVGGHNIDAAAMMGQLRNAVRCYAWEGHAPATVLEATNRLLCGLEPGVLATCCYIELNLDDGIAAVARAGHPPPLLIADGEARFAEIPADPPLGTDPTQKFEQSTMFLSSGETMVLFTDGLVETRVVSLDKGLRGLLAATLTAVGGDGEDHVDPELMADHLLQSMTQQGQRDDDVAMLILRYEPTHALISHSGPRIIRRHLPSSAASAGVARRFAADVMTDWGAPELADVVSLCISELVTNALIHTATDVELVLRLSPESVRVEVVDQSDRMPVVRSSQDEDTSGRGLHIVEAISNDWGVEPYRSGKSVWFQINR